MLFLRSLFELRQAIPVVASGNYCAFDYSYQIKSWFYTFFCLFLMEVQITHIIHGLRTRANLACFLDNLVSCCQFLVKEFL